MGTKTRAGYFFEDFQVGHTAAVQSPLVARIPDGSECGSDEAPLKGKTRRVDLLGIARSLFPDPRVPRSNRGGGRGGSRSRYDPCRSNSNTCW